MTSQQLNLFNPKTQERHASWFSDALENLGVKEEPGWPDLFGEALQKWHRFNTDRKIRVLSLFSGAGGLDIGFHDAGFQIIECNELEEAFATTLRENTKKGTHLEGASIVCMDVNNYDPDYNTIDFIIGGPPCQTFSAAGARAAGVNGIDDDRGNLFLQYARILKKLKPQGFLFENVYRIVGAQGGKPWEKIQKTFQDLGYTLCWRILDSADYGVPQHRERLIIVGSRTGSYKFPYPTHGPDSLDNRDYYTAGHAIANIAAPNIPFSLGGRHGHLLKDIPPGLNYSFYTEKLGHPQPIFSWRSKFSDYLYKADPNTPVRTIKAQGGQYTGPFHWDSRPFTLEELKRLQTFPDIYYIVGTHQKVIHQLGNSVPPQLARVLALSILKEVFGCDLPFNIQYMPNSLKLGFRQRKRLLTEVYARKAMSAFENLSTRKLKKVVFTKKIEHVRISDDLQLIISKSKGQAHFTISVVPNKGTLALCLVEPNIERATKKYEIEILPDTILSANTELSSIILNSSSTNPNSVLALWKYLEILAKQYFYKDDLVQLFGYYQYKHKYSIRYRLHDNSLTDYPFWKVLSQVNPDKGVGKITSINELARLYSVSIDDFMAVIIDMKRIGFEIRNHNTNKQIRRDSILIPYAFPSLNERSIQRFKEL